MRNARNGKTCQKRSLLEYLGALLLNMEASVNKKYECLKSDYEILLILNNSNGCWSKQQGLEGKGRNFGKIIHVTKGSKHGVGLHFLVK